MPKTQNTSGFSKRELKVLLLLSFDFTKAEVAGLLFIDYETVKKHLRNMRERHQVSSVQALLMIAVLGNHINGICYMKNLSLTGSICLN